MDLSVAHEKIGDTLVSQGENGAGVEAYRNSLAIIERLAASKPDNAGWQRHLLVSLFKLASAGHDSVHNYRRALDIAEAMKANGVLASLDAHIPDLLRQRIREAK